jgi:hypothetical protein
MERPEKAAQSGRPHAQRYCFKDRRNPKTRDELGGYSFHRQLMMTAISFRFMAAAGLKRGKFRKLSILDQREIVADRPVHGPEGLDPGRIQFPKRSAPDASHDNRIHRLSVEGLEGLALAVVMIHIRIEGRPEISGFAVDNYEHRGRPEVTEYRTLQSPVLRGRKSDFHDDSPILFAQFF